MKTVIIRKNNIQIQGVREVDLKEVQRKLDRLPKSGGIITV
jgi:hypothetical protein